MQIFCYDLQTVNHFRPLAAEKGETKRNDESEELKAKTSRVSFESAESQFRSL